MAFSKSESKTLADEAIGEEKDAQDKALWGNPANGIIRGINKNENVPPTRAIWEMVQNARDQSNGKANIIFSLDETNFVFKHDGIPFTPETLKALILQTSSKNGKDSTKAGQYGTGFLTTHLFGKKFMLSGARRMAKAYYYNFDNFLIDRTPNKTNELISNLKTQCNEPNKWNSNPDDWDKKPNEWTTFKYQLGSDYEKPNAKEAMLKAPAMVPLVMAINPSINSISFCTVEGTTKFYSQEMVDHTEFITNDYSIKKYTYLKNDIEDNLFLLESNVRSSVNDKDPLFVVILPLHEKDGKYFVAEYRPDIPNLMIFLPLMGTESWGINFYIHSRDFTCSNDNRDSLRFVDKSKRYTTETDRNKQVIDKASNAIISFITNNYTKFENEKNLVKINFKRSSGDDFNEYYESLEDKFIEGFKSLKLFTNAMGEPFAVSSAKVLAKEISEKIEDKPELLPSIYYLLKLDEGKNCIPQQNELLYWSHILQEWYPDNKESCFVDFQELERFIDSTNEHINEDDLLNFDKILVNSHLDKVFGEKKLIPTETGERKVGKYLRVPIALDEKFRSVLDVLIPNDTKSFVNPKFKGLIELVDFTKENIKEAIGKAITAYNDKQKTYLKSFKDGFNQSSIDGKIETDIIKALIKFVAAQLKDNSEAFYSKILSKMAKFYNINEYSPEFKIDKDDYEYTSAMRTVIDDAFYQFTIMDDSEQEKQSKWIDECLSLIYSYKNTQESTILDDYKIYRNRNNHYDWAENLFVAEDVPEDLLDIYDNIINSIKDESEKENKKSYDVKSIRNILVDKCLEPYFKKERKKTGVELGSEIYKKMVPDESNWQSRLTADDYKKTTLLIITKIQSKVDGGKWEEFFPSINAHKAVLFFSIVTNKDEKKSNNIFRLINKSNEELEEINSLLDNPNYQKIIQLGKLALQQEQDNTADFEYKKQLGSYVEDILAEYIKESLKRNDKLTVVNEQNGKDLVIKLNDVPIYYIEVKSRWSACSVMMSKTQTNFSTRQKENYALCEADMSGFSQENVLKHEYPKDVVETKDRMKFLVDIGKRNMLLTKITDENSENIHIGGDYKTVIPQTIIKQGEGFDDFIQDLKSLIKAKSSLN